MHLSKTEKERYELSLEDRKHAKKTTRWMFILACIGSIVVAGLGLYNVIIYFKNQFGL